QQARITLTRRSHPESPSGALLLRKTLRVAADSPAVRVRIAGEAGSDSQFPRYTVHNRVALPQGETHYFMPTISGVDHGVFHHGRIGGSQTQSVLHPPQGWLA